MRSSSPVLAMYKAQGLLMRRLQRLRSLVADGGYGHTASLYVNVNET